MRGRIEDRAKDVRSCELKLSPNRMLRPGLPFGNRSERQQDNAVGKIGAGDHILDPVENDRSGGCKQNFVLIGEQPTCGEGRPLASRQRVSDSQGGKPLTLSNARTRPLLAAMNNSRSSRGMARTGATLGSITPRKRLERTVFADPCSPAMAKTGLGATRSQRP